MSLRFRDLEQNQWKRTFSDYHQETAGHQSTRGPNASAQDASGVRKGWEVGVASELSMSTPEAGRR